MNNKASHAFSEFREMDALSAQKSPIHALSPAIKLLVTLAYIITVVSFPKYDLSAVTVMFLYPLVLSQISNIPLRICLYKMRVVLPLIAAVGIFNPLLDREIIYQLGRLSVSGGFISMLVLLIKGVLALMASFLLIATTGMDSICAALRKLHVPNFFVTLLLLTYRYISLMMNEVSIMTEAYHLRAAKQKGIHISAWGSFLGQLLLRSMDRANELYQSMQLRGFNGHYRHAPLPPVRAQALLYAILWIGFFLAARRFNLPALLGGLFV